MQRFKKRNLWFVVFIGAIIFTVFVNEIGYDKLLFLLSNVNKPLVLLVVFFNLLNLIAFVVTWHFLSPANIGVYKLFKYMAGTFINNITPPWELLVNL